MQTVVLLGTSIEIAEARWLPLGLRVLILYFALLFGVYAISDVQRHIVPFTRIARGLTISPKDEPGILIETGWNDVGEIDRISFLAEVVKGQQQIVKILPKLGK